MTENIPTTGSRRSRKIRTSSVGNAGRMMSGIVNGKVAMAHTKMFNMSVAAAVVNGGSKALTIKGGGDE